MKGKFGRALKESVILGTVRNLGYLWIFLALTLIVAFIAYHLQQNAFPKSGASAGQISVTVYARLNPARLSLKSTVYPNALSSKLSQSAGPSTSPALPTTTPVGNMSSPPASPSSSSPATSALSPTCYEQVDSGTIATQYRFPTSVATSETLKNVDLGDDRIDSMFPPGQITSDYRIVWQGVSGLSPSLSATNLSTAESASEATFFAGVFYGLGAGFLVPFFQGFPDALDRARSDRRVSKHTPGM